MSKIRVLSDQLANQIAAGEVVERPASVAKELVENAIDAGARRIVIDVEAGGRRLLRVMDDGEGMTRDDALLAFERHATSKISRAEDLSAIATLGFRGEALASIASVARVELVTKTEDAVAATRVVIEGGRMRDVKDAAHPTGTTFTVRDLFFNVPARRKFLRSEATESFHLTNLVTHYALAHPEIAFTLTNNGRETLRAAPATALRERAYQIFGAEFLDNLLEVDGGLAQVARVRGYVSAPRERRTSRDAQYLFINGRYVRDRLIGRALSEGYRSILPLGVYPAALLFLEVPLEEVDVNVHPAKTEVRFRRAAAVADAVREAVRQSLASAGYARGIEAVYETVSPSRDESQSNESHTFDSSEDASQLKTAADDEAASFTESSLSQVTRELVPPSRQGSIEFGFTPPEDESFSEDLKQPLSSKANTARGLDAIMRHAQSASPESETVAESAAGTLLQFKTEGTQANAPVINEGISEEQQARTTTRSESALPPIASAANLVREVPLESVSTNIRPLGQLEESFIIATDDEGLLLIDQHVAHERILFDKYRAMEGARAAESQHLLMPETFDLTPAQAAAFDIVASELEAYGFGLMRLSGRTVAIKAVPADLPAGEARNMLAEILETVDAEKRGAARATLRDDIAASLACHAAIKINTPLAVEKMRWLIDRLLMTSSPTTCPHGRPVILRLTMRDIEKGFHRS
ncbi:MAG: mismatch repair protein MutL [Acidobacteriota bacterium]|jgi:DNA mismatch repair protein MutL|nr:mismatch repair protein MutL [Acidobacteriota bacterium]